MDALFLIGSTGSHSLIRKRFDEGQSPEYLTICAVSDQEAAALIRSRLVVHLFNNSAVIEQPGLSPGELLHVERDCYQVFHIKLKLPRTRNRPEISLCLPDWEDILYRATAVTMQLLVRRTGIGFHPDLSGFLQRTS